MLPKRKKSIKKEEAVPRHAEDDDDASSSSLSEASLQLDQAAEKRLPLNSGSGGNSSSGEESFDLEIGVNNASGSVDLDVLTDDEEEDDDAGDDDETDEGGDQLVDLLKDGAKRRSLQKKLSESLLNPEEEEEMATFELDRLLYLRRTVIWFYSMGMGATGALAYLYASGTLSIGDESMEEWLVPVVLVAIWLLVAIVVFLYDRAAHRALNKLQLTATKHTKIVNSLFPENFRSRMLKEQSRRIKQKERRDRSRRGSGGDSVKSGKSAGNNSFSGKLSLGSLGNKKRRRRNRKEQRKRRGGRRPDTLAAEAASSPANATLATAAGTEITEDSDVADDNISMSDGEEGLIPKDILTNKPIADFFPHCTVLFADIAGFTAWSSVRDPTAVFTLLESLYSCFDGIARRLKVFKVETIGDCYVAVTGLPEPQADHAIRMAQFSRACMGKMMQIVRALEKHLGPDTGDLSMRFGLHSGPVTAGVMRGEKSRFQLFGDTVNTAARIESTGMRDKVHLSESTAEQLKETGKDHWVELRDIKVQAKGKGRLQTYWLVMKPGSAGAAKTGNSINIKTGNDSFVDNENNSFSLIGGPTGNKSFGVNGIVAMFEKAEKLNKIGERTRRQADYTVEALSKVLKKIVAQRWGTNAPVNPTSVDLQQFTTMEATLRVNQPKLPIQEASQAIDFSSCLNTVASTNVDRIRLPRNVLDELEDFVTTIASMYHASLPFHCWEHASHVTISLTKLHSRLVDPSKNGEQGNSMATHQQWKRKMPKGSVKKEAPAAAVVGQSDAAAAFGIPNDPMVEFALVFAAMIHDIDHSGYPNAKLVKENSDVSKKYGKKSPAEQHSLDVAWDIFQRPAYQHLRRFIYSTESEMQRFRQLVVTLVMATDIVDRDIMRERNKRWEKVFTKKAKKTTFAGVSMDVGTINQRATLVLETMIQASNIAHCTQHWNVYIKWNKKLFQEMCDVYKTGRKSGQKDPADFWYQGELAFFDDVVIPLAKNLMESGAFGDSAEEFLTYAKSNRRDWQAKGRDMVQEYLSEIRTGNGLKNSTHSNGMKVSTHSTSSAMSSLWSSDGSLSFTPKWSKPSLGSASNSNLNFQNSISSIASSPVVPLWRPLSSGALKKTLSP